MRTGEFVDCSQTSASSPIVETRALLSSLEASSHICLNSQSFLRRGQKRRLLLDNCSQLGGTPHSTRVFPAHTNHEYNPPAAFCRKFKVFRINHDTGVPIPTAINRVGSERGEIGCRSPVWISPPSFGIASVRVLDPSCDKSQISLHDGIEPYGFGDEAKFIAKSHAARVHTRDSQRSL